MSKRQRQTPSKSQRINLPPSAQERIHPQFRNTSDLNQRLLFSFRYAATKEYGAKHCTVHQHTSLYDKLRILSSMELKQIESSPRETHGYELIPSGSIRCGLPDSFEKLKEVAVFRFGIGKSAGRIVGNLEKNCLYVFFIDSDFTLYDHGS